jgi:hypothetical protein
MLVELIEEVKLEAARMAVAQTGVSSGSILGLAGKVVEVSATEDTPAGTPQVISYAIIDSH